MGCLVSLLRPYLGGAFYQREGCSGCRVRVQPVFQLEQPYQVRPAFNPQPQEAWNLNSLTIMGTHIICNMSRLVVNFQLLNSNKEDLTRDPRKVESVKPVLLPLVQQLQQEQEPPRTWSGRVESPYTRSSIP